MKKNHILFGTLLGVITFTTGTFALNKSFTDLSNNDWSYDAISNLNAMGLLDGYPDGTIRPNDLITREETFTLLDKYNQMLEEKLNDVQIKTPEATEFKYTNGEYNFSLTFPKTWEGLLTTAETPDENLNVPKELLPIVSINFGFSEQDSLFMINVFEKKNWAELQKDEGPKPTLLKEENGYVYSYAIGQYAANPTMEARMAEIDSIIATFK